MTTIIGKGVEDLVKWVKECVDAGGVPLITTKYAGRRFEYEGKPAVVVRCWGAGERVKGGMIYDIPEELIEKFEKYIGDYKWLLREYKQYLK